MQDLRTDEITDMITVPDLTADRVSDTTTTPRETSPKPYTLGPGDYTFTFNHQSRERLYFAHVPPSYDPSSPIPAVLVLHGGGGQAEDLGGDLSGFDRKADREGFIALYPEGTKQGRLENAHTWNAGDCSGIPNTNCINPAGEAGVDDVGYIRKVLDDLESKFNIDERRIYATGFSNGGQMVQRLGCEMSERLAAIAPVSGTLLQNPCKPA